MSEQAAFNVPADVAYFNTATLAPQLHAVRAAGETALARRGQPWAISAADWFADIERLRALFAQIIGASAEGVALVPATSYGFAVAARNLPLRGDQRVLVLAEEYPSGVYTWRAAARRSGAEIVTVTREPGQVWTDAVQPDFLVTVGYKWLLGPFSVGYLYAAEEHRQGEPLEENWIARAGSEDFARLVDYPDEYQPGARRFDVGQRTKFELTPMAIAAVEQILEWQVPRVAATLAKRTSDIARRAAGLGLDPIPDAQRGPHLLGVRLREPARARVTSALAERNCFVAARGSSLRISPHLHTTDEDVDRLLDGLTDATQPHATQNRPPPPCSYGTLQPRCTPTLRHATGRRYPESSGCTFLSQFGRTSDFAVPPGLC